MKPKPHTVVVGGTRGIGREVVRHFVRAGQNVTVIGRRVSQDTGVSSHTVDLAIREAVLGALAAALKENGRVSNLVLLQRYRGEGDAWQGELDVSLTATKTIIERLAGEFTRQKSAALNSIVIVGSNASRLVAGEQSVGYHAAKAALRQMARYYACAFASRGLRVNCVTPGIVLKDEARDFYRKNKALTDLYGQVTPLGRMGSPKDIADAIAFLCSPSAAFITGQEIVVDGGLSLLWQGSLASKLTFPKSP
jgi:NAD(P)-dependent dehydrogenase (short-subunit alcohol dehydrogenase family)